MNDQILWFATRGAGIVSLVLLTVVGSLGIVAAVGRQSSSWPRFLTVGLHRNLALLSVAFLGIHIVTAVLDPFADLGWVAAAVPFASSYRPLWVGLGVISVDLALAVVVTSLVRVRLGQRTWRAVHWLAYAAWPLAILHGIGSGSDASASWMLVINAACITTALVAVAIRVLAARPDRRALMAATVEMSAFMDARRPR